MSEISERTYFIAKQTRRILEDVAEDLWNANQELRRYKDVAKAAHHWNLWHTIYSSGVDEPEEVELKEALFKLKESG